MAVYVEYRGVRGILCNGFSVANDLTFSVFLNFSVFLVFSWVLQWGDKYAIFGAVQKETMGKSVIVGCGKALVGLVSRYLKVFINNLVTT